MRGAGMRLRVVATALVVVAALGSCTSSSEAPVEEPATRPPGADPSRIILTPTTSPDTSQAFSWRTSVGGPPESSVQIHRAGDRDVRTVDAYRRTVTFDGWGYTARHHSAVVHGLRAGTRYRYRVGADERWSGWATFRTADDSGRPWSFAYFGDSQVGLADQWPRTVGRAMRDRGGLDLMVQVGDLVDAPTDDGQWSDWFRALTPYRRTVNTISAVGNHELVDDPELSQYRSHFRFPSNGPDGLDETTFSIDYQGVRFIALDTNHIDDDAQRGFLQDQLRDDGGRWTVVVLHRPIFAAAVGRDSEPQRTAWLSTLERYGADLVLQGHDHVYARGYVPVGSDAAAGSDRRPMYVVSVAGDKYYELSDEQDDDWTDNGALRVAAAGETPTYQLIRVTPDALVVRSVVAADGPGGDAGSTLDTFRITR